MNIFDFKDYKTFTQKALEARPKRGHGQYRKLAEALRLSSVAVSQIFRGPRDLSPEQALETSRFLHLGPEETDFFLLLVSRSRAGSQALGAHLETKIEAARGARAELAKRVRKDAEMSEQAKAIFYSDWRYSAVRIASSIPGLHATEAVAKKLGLDEETVAATVRFLLEHGLCKPDGAGFTMGPASTMLAKDSPFINNHRRNWRLKGLDHLRQLGPSDLFYSGLVSLSKDDLKAVQRELADVIARFTERVKDSPAETLACMNLDWFELRR